MAGSMMRTTSFGYNKSTPTSSPRSSPPSTLSSGKSRLPVFSRSNSSTPHRPISGPTTATRVNLTPINNNRTPSPHPSPDEGPQVKVVYGRVDDKPPTTPTEPSSDASPKDGLLVEEENKDKHGSNNSQTLLEEEMDETPILSRDPDRVVKSQSPNTTITLTPCSPTKSIGKAQSCEDRKISFEDRKTSFDSTNPTTYNARAGQVNFSHPGRAKGGRNSIESTSSHSITHSTSGSDNTTMLSSTTPSSNFGFPPRTTSRQALVDLPVELHAESATKVKCTEKRDREAPPSSFKPERSTNADQNDDEYRTVRLSLRPDSAQSILGPTLRVSEHAEGLLRGQDDRPTTGRLRMPSFGTTSSDESTVAKKPVASARSAAIRGLKEKMKSSTYEAQNVDFDLVGRRAFSEKRVLDNRSSSMTSVLRHEQARHVSSSTSEGGIETKDDIKTTAINNKNSILRDRHPSPHTALLFNRALTSGNDVQPSTPRSLVKSKTSPNLVDRGSSSPGTPPDPPPKDTPKTTEDRIRSLSPSKYLPRRALKSPPPPPPGMVLTGLRPGKQHIQKKLSISRPSAFVESWSSPIPSHDSRGFNPVSQFSASTQTHVPAPASMPMQDARQGKSTLRKSMEAGEQKKLPHSTSRPRLIASNIRNLFQRRSNNEITPNTTKIYTPTTSPTSTQLTWTPTLTSPSKSTAASRLKARVHLSTPPTGTRPPTRGKPLISPSPFDAYKSVNTNDDVLTRGTNLAMHLFRLASSAATTSPQSSGVSLSRETALTLAEVLVTTITATREAQAASIGASAKADEAKIAYEGAREGVAECVKLIEKCLV